LNTQDNIEISTVFLITSVLPYNTIQYRTAPPYPSEHLILYTLKVGGCSVVVAANH